MDDGIGPPDPVGPDGTRVEETASEPPFEHFPDLDGLLDAAAGRIVDGVDPVTFVAWFVAESPRIAPRLGAALRDAAEGDLRAPFARALWNRFPRPDNRFRPDPLPTPTRNDPCPCGSGRKYKQCCLDADARPDPTGTVPLLVYVLNTYTDRALETLDGWSMEPDGLLDALVLWSEEGRGERAVRLAAPMFSPERRPRGRLPRHAADVLEVLLDDWPPGFRDAAFTALAERLGTHRDAELAGIAVRALARRLHEGGDPTSAWARLRSGARRFPDDPEFAELEIDLLNDEGRFEESAAVASAWHERLVALDPENAEYAEGLLERAADIDPEIALARACEEDAVLDRLVTLLEETPPGPIAGTHARIAAGTLVLAPTPALADVETRWEARFGAFADERDTATSADAAAEGTSGRAASTARGAAVKGATANGAGTTNPKGGDGAGTGAASHDATGEAANETSGAAGDGALDDDALTEIVAFLDDEPLALSSFPVLEALVSRSGAWVDEPWGEAVCVRLLLRAEALLYRHVSREMGFETPEGLPDWGAMVWETAPRVSMRHPANRPALALLAGLAKWYDDTYDEGEPDDRLPVLLDALRGLDPDTATR